MTGDLAVWLRAQLYAQAHWLRTDCDDFMDECQECGFAQQPASPFSHAFTLADITAKRAILDLHRPAWVVGFAGKGPPFCDLCGRRYACGPVPASLTPEESETMDYPCPTLRLLAQPYAGRPGWHNEWNVS